MAVGLVIYSTARAFKAKAKSSRPRPENTKAKAKAKAKKFSIKAKANDSHRWCISTTTIECYHINVDSQMCKNKCVVYLLSTRLYTINEIQTEQKKHDCTTTRSAHDYNNDL